MGVRADQGEVERLEAPRRSADAVDRVGRAARAAGLPRPDETTIWDALDGEKRLIELRHHHDNDKIINLVRRLVHSDVQALKLSMMPWALYAKRPAWRRHICHRRCRTRAGSPASRCPQPVGLTDYYKHDVARPMSSSTIRRRRSRTCSASRIRRSNGRPTARRSSTRSSRKGLVKEGRVRILEIGAGLGYVAQHVIERLHEAGRAGRLHDRRARARARRCAEATARRHRELDPRRRARREGARGRVRSDPVQRDGRRPAGRSSRAPTRLERGNADREKLRASRGAATRVNGDDAPEPFYLQTGAFQLIARIRAWLAPGGAAVVTEFGDRRALADDVVAARSSRAVDAFRPPQQTAAFVGLKAAVEFVIDLLELDRDAAGPRHDEESLPRTARPRRRRRGRCSRRSATRPSFSRTPSRDKLDLATIGELRWDRVEDRLMGLVPHEFKALLVATKPSSTRTVR